MTFLLCFFSFHPFHFLSKTLSTCYIIITVIFILSCLLLHIQLFYDAVSNVWIIQRQMEKSRMIVNYKTGRSGSDLFYDIVHTIYWRY
jgi:hypothetical protein